MIFCLVDEVSDSKRAVWYFYRKNNRAQGGHDKLWWVVVFR